MENRVESSAVSKPFSSQPELEAGADFGEYRGQQVKINPDASSLIEDAAEELTFAAGEKVEKKITERKLRVARPTRLTAAEHAEFYIRQLSDLGGHRKLNQFLESLREIRNITPNAIRTAVEKFFSDVSVRWAALDTVRMALEESGENPVLLNSVIEVMKHYHQAHGPEIRAGLNIADSVIRFADSGLAGIQELRDSYRNSVLRYEGFQETYRSLISTFGIERFPQAVDFLIQAVGNDLSSQGPSISPVLLQRIVNDLYQVEVLGNIHRGCRDLLFRMSARVETELRISADTLMDRVLELKGDPMANPERVQAVVEETGLKETELRICFTRELKELIADIPMKAYADIRKREQILETVQTVQDTLIAIEEKETL